MKITYTETVGEISTTRIVEVDETNLPLISNFLAIVLPWLDKKLQVEEKP